MINFLKRLLAPEGAPAPDSAIEKIGEAELPRRLGLELLHSTPRCWSFASRMRDRLEYLTREDVPELIDRVLARFALYVLDLPASEKDHHSAPYALLEHSLEVAYGTLSALSGSSFRISQDPLIDHRERPSWIYGAFLVGLGHDLAKAFDYHVTLPRGGEPWDPLREPLAAYARRHGRKETGREFWTFRKGRGLKGQVARTGELLRLILPPSACAYLAGRLPVLEQIFACRTREEQLLLPLPARAIKTAYGIVDRHTSLEEKFEKRPPAAEVADPEDDEEVEAPAPPEDSKSEEAEETVEEVEEDPSEVNPENASSDPLPEEDPSEVDPENASSNPLPEEDPPAFGDEDPEIAPVGDAVEQERRAAHQLDPAVFLNSIWRQILSGGLQRNGKLSAVYITDKFVWLTSEWGLRRMARVIQLSPSDTTIDRMVESLRKSPLVVVWKDQAIVRAIRPGVNSHLRGAIAIKCAGFLSKSDLAHLGTLQDDLIHTGPWSGFAPRKASKKAAS